MQQLISLYKETFGAAPETVEKLSGAGSNRIYYRLQSAGKSVIGAVGTSVEENHAFITIARHFRAKNLRVPEIYAVSADETRYLQQDLGNRSLFDALKNGRENNGNYSDYEKSLLRRVIAELPRLQILGAQGLDFSVCYPQPEFDRRNVMFDLNYFKYSFLKATGVDFHEILLEDDFEKMAEQLSGENLCGFMYRDFQARNIMLDEEGNPYFIDFQGGRRGPFYYDVASFAWQASARYSESLRCNLVRAYYDELQKLTTVPAFEEFNEKLQQYVLFRLLQVLGAYGFRGYFERKPHFIASIPPALENLQALLAEGACDSFPYLKKVLTSLLQKESLPCPALPSPGSSVPFSGVPCSSPLTVRIFSFSYKKGIPQDPSGNGGGYVFDCRATNNPGRYKEYKTLTGLDQPVIDFLEKDGEILRFLDNIYPLVDFHVQRWLDRNFTDLQISFGCTGGQHRSVYSAQHVADHLKEKFGSQIKIELTHREQRPQAFILAAGLGTRLKPLTDTMPKALVKVGDKTLLERTIETLQSVGFQNIVVNVHHFSDQIKTFIKNYQESLPCPAVPSPGKSLPCSASPSPSLYISDETSALLDTGGGLLKARHKFSQARPILIHNVDILSNADLKSLYEAPVAAASGGSPAIATLLVSRRETSRYLHFDTNGNLIGWQNTKTGETKGRLGTPYAFSGIHVVSPQIFPLLEEYAGIIKHNLEATQPQSIEASQPQNLKASKPQSLEPSKSRIPEIPKFSITDFYLWACQRATIKAHLQEDLQLTDVGKLATLEQLNAQ